MKLINAVNALYKNLDNLNTFSSNEIWKKNDIGWNLIINFFGCVYNDELPIIYLKFILPVNEDKTELSNNSLYYLKDLNDDYTLSIFNNENDLSYIVKNILDNNLFGENLKELSENTLFSVHLKCSKILKKYNMKYWEYIPKIKNNNEKINFDYVFNIADLIGNANIKYNDNGTFSVFIEIDNKNIELTSSDNKSIIKTISECINKILK